MKNISKYILSIFLIGTMSCSDFMDKYPTTSLTEATAFETYDNFKTFSWGFYSYFTGFPTNGSYYPANMQDELNSDNLIRSQAGNESIYAYQKKELPNTDGNWNFSYIRRVYIMLQNIDQASMTQVEKDHWRSVGLFFKSLRYFDLIKRYGDVPWVDKLVKDTDLDMMYGKRTPRATVAKNVLDELLWAEKNIKENGDGDNTINVHVVRALISRFCLFEGTWQKYHGISDGSVYLDECIRVSEELLKKYPTIMSSYENVYNSLELFGKPGIILCKQYDLASEITHSIGRVVRTSAWKYDLTKDAVDSYLCTDGKPVGSSSVYAGDKDVYDQFRNRDRRLYYTVMPPYKVSGVTGATSQTWSYHSDPKFREYMDLMVTLSPTNGKRLPVSNFAGNLVNMAPHFNKFPGGQGFVVSELGFYCWKYYNTHQVNQSLRTDTEEYPLFRIEEVMLNYAEAAFERGKFTQTIADVTINKLRTRANIAKMTVTDINATFDPARDQSVDPVLWEIRRERRIELMADGFRFEDLKRWKKAEYMNKQPLGVWVKNSEFGNKLKLTGGTATEGYVYYFAPPKGWLDKYYLEPVPMKEIILNPNLAPNNPGWE